MQNHIDYSNIAKMWDDELVSKSLDRMMKGDSRPRAPELVGLRPRKWVRPIRLTPARGSEQYVKALNNLISRLA
jgi:hypothetical protein